MRRPVLSLLPAVALIALAAMTGLAAGPARAVTLGQMTLQIGGRSVTYQNTDSATAGSGWVPRPEGQQLSILWQGPKATDLLLMELVVKDGQAVSGRIALPEARDGALEAKMPDGLQVHLARVRTDGGWLKIRGRLSGTLSPVRRDDKLPPGDAVRISARFDSWVVGIFPPAPKSAAKKAVGKTAATRAPASGRAAQPPRLRPAPAPPMPQKPKEAQKPPKPQQPPTPPTPPKPREAPKPQKPPVRPKLRPGESTAAQSPQKSERPRSPGASQTAPDAGALTSAPRR